MERSPWGLRPFFSRNTCRAGSGWESSPFSWEFFSLAGRVLVGSCVLHFLSFRRISSYCYTTRRDDSSFLQCCPARAAAHDVYVCGAGDVARDGAAGEPCARAVPKKGHGWRRCGIGGERAARNKNSGGCPCIGFCSCADAEIDRTGALGRGLLPGASRRSFSCHVAAGNRAEIAARDYFDGCGARSGGQLERRWIVPRGKDRRGGGSCGGEGGGRENA